MTLIENGPYYVIHAQGAILGTFGGLNTNMTGEFVNVEGNNISGLYAAGECVVVWGRGLSSGTSVGGAVTYGRIAG